MEGDWTCMTFDSRERRHLEVYTVYRYGAVFGRGHSAMEFTLVAQPGVLGGMLLGEAVWTKFPDRSIVPWSGCFCQ